MKSTDILLTVIVLLLIANIGIELSGSAMKAYVNRKNKEYKIVDFIEDTPNQNQEALKCGAFDNNAATERLTNKYAQSGWIVNSVQKGDYILFER